jgi:oligopeptide transport system substrate-binding protein
MKAWLFALVLLTVPAQAEAVLNRGNGAEPESLDPAHAGSVMEANILGDMMVGLTTLDAAARPIPGIAERWETSQDGLTWTFHLRKAHWSNGAAVTTGDFLTAWRRVLDPRTASRTTQNLWVLKNAHAISAGAMPPGALGVTAPDATTLKVILEYPAPYLPELLTLAAALPLPPGAVFKAGSYLSNGPYLLKAWTPGDHVTLVKNPRFYDVASVKIDTINYYPTIDTQAALRRLRAGELDMQTPLPTAQLPWLKANMPGAAHVMPSLALAYLPINLKDPALADIRVRRALNLAYDREAVTAKVLKLNETPAYSYVPPQLGRGGPQMDFQSLPMPARVALARKLMQDAGYGPFNKLSLTYLTPGNPDNKRLAAVFQAMARQIFVDLRIVTADYPLVLRALRQGQYQLAYTNWLADFSDVTNFLDLLRTGSPGNYAGYQNPKFDATMAAAQKEPDPARRAALLQGAHRIALADMPWVPIRFLSQTEAVGPRVGGYVQNPWDFNRSRWLWIKK